VRTDTAGAAICDLDHGCITCGDEAVPMRVRRVDTERGLALCEDGQGRRSSVETALVEPVAAGDELLVHAGTAIARAS
jgi:hydrogenase expression/formation protein HypC